MQQRESERHQILDHGTLAELIDFDGLKCDIFAPQRADNLAEMTASPHQDRNAFVRIGF